MTPRIDFAKVASSGYDAMGTLEHYARQSGLEPAGREAERVGRPGRHGPWWRRYLNLQLP
ncbi:MAG TPA: hypothetical protein VMD08_03520 [Candidatus Baltobacteraceae bacterium]|nr:hypothetical protein [Candidatus Baltobacteraceae bacterium]